MKESFYRTAMLLGPEAEGILASAHAVVFGVGGVGGHAAEALARCGVGRLTIVDSAVVKPSNLNRQLCAEKRTIGMPKVEAMKERLEAVSDCEVTAVSAFVTAENAASLIPEGVSAVIDAVDNVTAKIALILECQRRGVPVFSSMGAGNRLDPTAVRIADVYKTSIDPLARVMRRELKRRGVKRLTVAYSVEEPKEPLIEAPDPEMKKNAPASVPFVPAVFGLTLASAAVYSILEKEKEI
ncbi:MAG: tRNA threonylcarbamoyladenosine dehydratase [Clostridiales bacterium]|nr:tRNA threonylcarbamoyladenosine dehydratase [Clostridiales bacterium]